MKLRYLAAALVLAGALHGPALAQTSVEDRLEAMERRIAELEKRLSKQDEVIVEKDREIARLSEQGAASEDAWFDKVEVSGAVEVEAAREKNYEGESSNGLHAATVDVAVAARVNAWTAADVALTMDDVGKIEVDEAILTLAPPDRAVALIAGRQVVPFGVYESNMVSDPLTLGLGETADDAIQLALNADLVSAAAFLFKGEIKRGAEGGEDGRIENFGVSAGYAMERDGMSLALGLSWINDLGESGAFDDVEARGRDEIAGGAASVVANFSGMQVIAEYVTAMDNFAVSELRFKDESKGARPSAWLMEAAYGFELGDKPTTAALGYQGTDEAVGLGLPKTRFLVGLSVELAESLSLSFEWARDNDYGTADGGTGKTANKATALLAAEF
ncbi:MAG: LbtU family siderophore porin [Defluviicoccus sp.]|nr:LbtU family siderophore porin [Defluviicoccus sp.]MDE0384229.1 LbtU family siderophore porin [Defluviicoccus sp.]